LRLAATTPIRSPSRSNSGVATVIVGLSVRDDWATGCTYVPELPRVK
jgi:hypothetical protein